MRIFHSVKKIIPFNSGNEDEEEEINKIVQEETEEKVKEETEEAEEKEKEVSKREMLNKITDEIIKKNYNKLIDINELRLKLSKKEDKELKELYKKAKNTYNKK
jgi:hypothetical protein